MRRFSTFDLRRSCEFQYSEQFALVDIVVVRDDTEFRRVKRWLSDSRRISGAAEAIRLAIDWVIDGARTRRYSIDQLQASEKTYIGNRVEHELLYQWGLMKEGDLDCIIEGLCVDVKFSLGTSWMIPPEAIDQLCIIVTADDSASKYSYGLFRAKRDYLAGGAGNRDGKRGITAAGRTHIDWIVRNGDLVPNFLLHLHPGVRQQILSHTSGQARVTELFRLVQDQPIPTTAIDTLAVQRDPSKRIRDNGGARDALKYEGIVIYGWRYDQDKLKKLRRDPLPRDHWMSIKIGDSEADIRRLGAEPR